jgi:membrane dipeptidase
MAESELYDLAKTIHNRVITLDTHCDINVKNFTDSVNYTQELKTQITLPKMKAGGLDVAWLIVYTGQDSLNHDGYTKAYDNAMAKFNAIYYLAEQIAPEETAIALNSDDVRRIHASGKKVIMIGIENAYPVGLDLTNIERFYDLGGRYMSLSHNGHSQFCDSNTGEENDQWLHNGLSDLGKLAVKEMNRLGMMIDVSHPSKEAMRQMVELSQAPIIASHSSARALCDHSRNLDDEQLQWLKNNGGVVQTVAFSAYLNTIKHENRRKTEDSIAQKILDSMGVKWLNRSQIRALPAEDRSIYYDHLAEMNPIKEKTLKQLKTIPEPVGVKDFVDHIDYMVDKIGIDHVGISSDFDGGGGIDGWNDASQTFNVTLELVRRGYSEEEIEQLWSGNLLRVLDEVEAVARDIQAKSS